MDFAERLFFKKYLDTTTLALVTTRQHPPPSHKTLLTSQQDLVHRGVCCHQHSVKRATRPATTTFQLNLRAQPNKPRTSRMACQFKGCAFLSSFLLMHATPPVAAAPRFCSVVGSQRTRQHCVRSKLSCHRAERDSFVSRRLRLPLPLSARFCQCCRPTEAFGHRGLRVQFGPCVCGSAHEKCTSSLHITGREYHIIKTE